MAPHDARQATVDRLPQEIPQRELRVQSVAGVAQMRGDDRPQPEAFIQLADQNQASIGGHARSLKRHLQEPVEGELKRLGFFLTHRVSPFLAEFLLSEPGEIKARRLFCEGEYHDQIGNPGLEDCRQAIGVSVALAAYVPACGRVAHRSRCCGYTEPLQWWARVHATGLCSSMTESGTVKLNEMTMNRNSLARCITKSAPINLLLLPTGLAPCRMNES